MEFRFNPSTKYVRPVFIQPVLPFSTAEPILRASTQDFFWQPAQLWQIAQILPQIRANCANDSSKDGKPAQSIFANLANRPNRLCLLFCTHHYVLSTQDYFWDKRDKTVKSVNPPSKQGQEG